MSNSGFVDVTVLSPNCSARADKIRKITLHHMAGIMTAEGCGNWFKTGTRNASSNYGIGNDGKIGLYVPEDKRAWTSSSRANDNQAVTIELSNNVKGSPWSVSDKVIERAIDLCEDICRRNGIDALHYTGKTDGNLTRHDMFIATNCPGSYLGGKLPYIAEQVNLRLIGEAAPAETVAAVTVSNAVKKGVLSYQKWLIKRFGVNIAKDGIAGPETRKASIYAWQVSLNALYMAGLAEDGLWGPMTSQATADHVCLRNGDVGRLVYILQGMLYFHKFNPQGLDGEFLAKTEKALRAYQTAEGIAVDGEAGKITFSRLFSS